VFLVLLIICGYFVYERSLDKTADVAQLNEANNAVDNNTAVTNTIDQSTAADQTTRDPNRYYNDKGNFSYVLPNEWKNKDLVFNVSPIDAEPDSGGACGSMNSQISGNLKNSLASKTNGSDFTQDFKEMFNGIYKSKILESDNGAKYAIGVDICNGVPVEENEIANAIRFRAIAYQNNIEISLVCSVDQSIIKSEDIRIGALEKLADDLWNHKNTNPEIQALFSQFEEVLSTLKFENI
jgi:hypothetical protein